MSDRADESTTSEATQGGGGRQVELQAPVEDQSAPAKFIPNGGAAIDWTCPRCGNVLEWRKPWSPEGIVVLNWKCSWCHEKSEGWIWSAKGGWVQLPPKGEFKGVPVLDRDLRWYFVCECSAVHRPLDYDFERDAHVEPTQWAIECKCGRKLELVLLDGKWNQQAFEFCEPEPPPPPPPAPESPPLIPDPLVAVTYDCSKCGEKLRVEASKKLVHDCERCGYRAKKHLNESGEWEDSPNADGSLMADDEVRKILADLEKGFEQAPPHFRTEIGFIVMMIGEDALRLMVHLAVKHENYDCVRWLAKHADLGRCRIPDDWNQNLESMLTDPTRPKAAREWNEVRDWKKEAGKRAHRSMLGTWVERVGKAAWWWRFELPKTREQRELEAAETGVRIIYTGDPEKERLASWTAWLRERGVSEHATPFPSTFANTGSGDSLIDEILLPILRWTKRNDAETWTNLRGRSYEDSAGRLNEADIRRQICRALGLEQPKPSSGN